MRARHRSEEWSSGSITGALVALGVVAGLLVAASYPVASTATAFVAVAVGIAGRTVWKQAKTEGVWVPGASGRLCVSRDSRRSNGTQWALTISVVEDY